MLYYALTIFLATQALARVPSFITVCGRRDPEVAECILRNVYNIREKLRVGIPSLDVPPIEPMILSDEIILANDSSFKAIAQDVKLWGFATFEATGLKVDFDRQRFDFDVSFDNVRLEAEYDVATKVIVPIVGKGPINIDAEGITAKVTLKYELVDHKNTKYLYFPSMTTKLKINDYKSHFTPREGYEGTLGVAINAALTENRFEVLKQITPNLERVISEQVLQIANRICKHFTYAELFPDRE